MKMKIKIKRLNQLNSFPEVIKKGEWIDLRASKSVALFAPQAGTLKRHTVAGQETSTRDVTFDFHMIPLGVAMKLPKGFEADLLTRSGTFKNYGIIQTNSMGIIDNSYSSNKDEWKLPVIATRNSTIEEGSRICQFRIQLSQKATFWQKVKWFFSNGVELVEVQDLGDKVRGGFGEGTGK